MLKTGEEVIVLLAKKPTARSCLAVEYRDMPLLSRTTVSHTLSTMARRCQRRHRLECQLKQLMAVGAAGQDPTVP